VPPWEFWLTFAFGLLFGLTVLWDFERASNVADTAADDATGDVSVINHD
jgi:hypothetical protein